MTGMSIELSRRVLRQKGQTSIHRSVQGLRTSSGALCRISTGNLKSGECPLCVDEGLRLIS